MPRAQLKLDKICKEVIELTHEVGDFILKEKNKFNPSDIQKKGFNDLVSYVDKTSEKKLIKACRKYYPVAEYWVKRVVATLTANIPG